MVDASAGYRSLERAASVLDVVELAPATASEIARRTGLSVSTAHRLAVALAELGFLDRGDDARFRLGRRFHRSTLEQAAGGALVRLRDETGESAQLWVRDGDERVCLVTADSEHELRATLPRGARLALPAGSAGRLLAEDPAAWEDVRSSGWVESIGRRTPGLASVSAPVVIGDAVVAAVCLALPWTRAEGGPGLLHGARVVAAAERIALALRG